MFSGISPGVDISEAYRDGVWHFYVVRYLSIATCAWLLYDHLLTVRQEFELIWKAPTSLAKYGFLLYRYAIPTSVILLIYSLSGFATGMDDACRRLIPTTAVLDSVPGCIADVIAVLHISTLWRRNVKVILALLMSFVATTIVGITASALALAKITQTIIYVPLLNVCTSVGKPGILMGAWIAGMTFDIVVLTAIFLNAFNRPRDPSTHLLCILQEDGMVYFMTVFAIRLLDLIIVIAAPLRVLGLVATLSWPAFAVALSRFIFKLREREPHKLDDPVELNMGSQVLLDRASASSHVTTMSRQLSRMSL